MTIIFNVGEDYSIISVPVGTRVRIHAGDNYVLGTGVILNEACTSFFESRTLQRVRIEETKGRPAVGEEWLFDTEDLEIIS